MTASTPTSGRPTHPRFRQRWISVRRDAGRRRLLRLLVLVGIAGVALGGLAILQSAALDLDHVSVAGYRNTTPEDIEAATGIARGDALVTADLTAAREGVEALPWVATASVRRSLPGSLEISVVERVPAAIIAGAGPSQLVDDTGRILGPAAATILSPPLISVLSSDAVGTPGEAVPEALEAALALAVELRSNPEGAVAAIQVQPELSITLTAGGFVRLGDGAELASKIEALRVAIERIDLDCLETLDLRVPTHPVLTRGASCS